MTAFLYWLRNIGRRPPLVTPRCRFLVTELEIVPQFRILEDLFRETFNAGRYDPLEFDHIYEIKYQISK